MALLRPQWCGQSSEKRLPRSQSGKAEYKSVTVSIDATAEEFTDFYLDDDVRPQWVRLSSHAIASRPSADTQIFALQSWQLFAAGGLHLVRRSLHGSRYSVCHLMQPMQLFRGEAWHRALPQQWRLESRSVSGGY